MGGTKRTNQIVQESKLRRTLNGTRTQPRDLSAYTRGRNLRSRGFSSKAGSPFPPGKYTINSALEKAEREDKRAISSKQTAGSMIEETLASSSKCGQKTRGLMRIISDPFYLMKSYEEIKSVPGNMTKGSTNETLDKIDKEWFEATGKKIRENQYRFQISRRVEIPKPNSNKTRPLTIASPRDKIVQKGIQMILEAIWEGKFTNSSHGFRPRRSVHSALKAIYQKGQTYKWVIQGDISKCFDKIPHEIVYNYLKEEIEDKAFLNLIRTYLTAGYKDPKGTIVRQKIGIPQGGILSPILCNIVMHKFDLFVEEQIKKFERGKTRRHNAEYQRLQHLRRKADNIKLRKKYLNEMRQIPHGDQMDPNFKRMMYIRYADDFVIMVTGTKDESIMMKNRCKEALRRLCGAELNEEKTLITNMKEGFTFLGADIRKLPRQAQYTAFGGSKARNRIVTRRLLLNAPIKSILEDLRKNRFLRRNNKGEYFPISVTNLTNLTHYDIITFYNQRINSIVNYYSYASNYSRIGTII